MSQLVIDVKGLVKRFGDVTAVAGIDLQVQAGTCVGILGPNGAGKTTTLEILEGLQTPTSGEVRILGLSWGTPADAPRLRARTGVALQETHFYDRLTVEETLTLFRSFFEEGTSVAQALAQVNLEEKRSTQLRKLSGGQRQRLALATALVGNPEVLFLDEPTTGLDPQSRRALWDVLGQLKARGCTLLLTTHYMEEAEKLCDRVVIVDHGRIVADGTPLGLIGSVGALQRVDLTLQPALPLERAAGLFGAIEGIAAVNPSPLEPANGHALTLSLNGQDLHRVLPRILEVVRAAGVTLSHLNTRVGTLDDVFVALTGRHLREEERA